MHRPGTRPAEAAAGTHRRILAAAQVLFAGQGYRRTSMRQIAERVGITKAALYYHFPGKDDILSRLTEPLLDELEETLSRAEAYGDPEAVRWHAIEGYLDVFLRHQATLVILVRDMSLLVQAPVAERFRAAVALANDLVVGADRSLDRRVRAAQAVAGLGDAVVIFSDVPPDELRQHLLAGVRDLLGSAPDGFPTGGQRRPGRVPPEPDPGRTRGRPSALGPEQARQARQMYLSGVPVPTIGEQFGVSRATIYRCIRNS